VDDQLETVLATDALLFEETEKGEPFLGVFTVAQLQAPSVAT
jgi:hypothetical protein